MVNELWFFLLISILFIAGSVWIILPSPAQRQKQKMRAQAYRLGLKVRKLTLETIVAPEDATKLYYYKMIPPNLSAARSKCLQGLGVSTSNANGTETDEELIRIVFNSVNLNHLNIELMLRFNAVGVLWDERGKVEDVTEISGLIDEVLATLKQSESDGQHSDSLLG